LGWNYRGVLVNALGDDATHRRYQKPRDGLVHLMDGVIDVGVQIMSRFTHPIRVCGNVQSMPP